MTIGALVLIAAVVWLTLAFAGDSYNHHKRRPSREELDLRNQQGGDPRQTRTKDKNNA